MASPPLNRLENAREGQEGNYASSETPSQGRITYCDLGLTLLPRSQIIQQDNSCSGLEVEEDTGERGAGRIAEGGALSVLELPVHLAEKGVARRGYDAKIDASNTLNGGLQSLRPSKEVAGVTQTQSVPSAVSDVGDLDGSGPKSPRIGRTDLTWGAGNDGVQVKIIYARKRRRVEAPPFGKVAKLPAQRPKCSKNPSSKNLEAVNEPHIPPGGSQNDSDTFDQNEAGLQLASREGSHQLASSSPVDHHREGSTASQTESISPWHNCFASDHSFMTIPQQHYCQQFTRFLSNMSIHLSHNVSSDEHQAMEQSNVFNRELDAIARELFPRLHNNTNIIARVLSFVQTFPMADSQDTSIPLDVLEHSLRHALHDARSYINGQKVHFDQHKEEHGREMKNLQEENLDLRNQILQMSQQLKNINDAKSSLLKRLGFVHTELEQTTTELKVKAKELEDLKARLNETKQHVDSNQPQRGLPGFLPGNETITAASQSRSSPFDSDTSRRTSSATIDLTGDDNDPSTAPTSTSGSSPATNVPVINAPATDVPAKRKAPSWYPTVYDHPNGRRPQMIIDPKKQRTNESRPSTVPGLLTAANDPPLLGEVAPSPAAAKRLEAARKKEEEKKRKAAAKEAKGASRDAEKEELRRAKQLESKVARNERAKVSKKANKDEIHPFTPADEEMQQRLLGAAGASATMSGSNDSSLPATSYRQARPTTVIENVAGGRTASSAENTFGQQGFAAFNSTADNEGLDDLFEGDEADRRLIAALSSVLHPEKDATQNAEIPQESTHDELEIYDAHGNIAKSEAYRDFVPPAKSQPIGLAALAANVDARNQTSNFEATTNPALASEEDLAKVALDIEALMEAGLDEDELAGNAGALQAYSATDQNGADTMGDDVADAAGSANHATNPDSSTLQSTAENEDFFEGRFSNLNSPSYGFSDNNFFNEAFHDSEYEVEMNKQTTNPAASRNYESSEDSEEE